MHTVDLDPNQQRMEDRDKTCGLVSFENDPIHHCLLGQQFYTTLANRSYMQYALECIEQTIFNLSEGVIINMKEQLTNAKDGL